MLSILGNRKIIVSILTMVFLIVGVQGMSYAQTLISIEVSPTSVAPGENITLEATVRNKGNTRSVGKLLDYYLSDTHTGTIPADNTNATKVGSVYISPLSPNGGQTKVGISLAAPSPNLTQTTSVRYRYYARIGTGTASSDFLTVTNLQPDLTVTLNNPYLYNPSGYYNRVAPGGRFTLNATVTNSGSGPSSASAALRIEYRASTLSTWSLDRTASISPTQALQIAAGRTSSHTVTLSAPSTPGTYYYRMYVVPLDNESNKANNYSNAVSIATASADLVVDTPTVDKSTVAPGESFTLTVTVRNNGIGISSSNTTLRYYLSTDSIINTTTDTLVGTADTIGILSGSNTYYQGYPNTSTRTVNLTAPTTPGTYYYGAYVSDLSNEPNYNIGNNYSTVAITVSAPPDLVADIFEFRPNTVAPGARLTLDATVTNDGEGRSPRTTLRFYESIDRRFRSEDEIDRVTVAELDSNRSTTESIPMTAPDTPGTYYYRVQVDEVANEEETFNNTSDYIVLFVETPLVLESVQPSISTLAPRERFTLTATLRNDGSTTSARTEVTFYRSSDDSITFRDTSIGTDFVSAIAARETGQVSLTLNAPTAAGTYFYGVCLGDATGSDVCPVTEISVVDVTIANIERPPMYWVDADEGTLQSLTGSEIEPFVSSVQNANSIAVDMAGGKVYWTEQTSDRTGRIRRANLNGFNIQLVKELTSVPKGLALDTSNGKLYLTNSWGKVQQMNLDGTSFQSNLIVSLDSPSGIAVDAAGGKVYWLEQTSDSSGRIQRADLDGSNVELVKELTSVPKGLALDTSNGKLYLTNSWGKVQRMDLDGRSFESNLILNLDSPGSIAVDAAAGKVYWAEANSIRRANLNGSNRQDVATGIGTPAGIALSVAPVSTDAPAAPGAVAATSDATALHANYPNPFNPETWIPYQLQQAADVQISIYSQSGVLVRELSLGYQGAGQYMSRSRAAHWDGRNQVGEPVASGLYFYTLTAGDFSATRRMLILK